MKNTLTYQNSIQHLLSNVDDGTNKLIVDGTEIPSSTWEGAGTFTIISGSATITIEQIENASNIMLQKVSTNNYKLVDAGAAGKVNLESDVTGTLPIGNGGTGSSAGDSKDLIATFTSADDDSIFNSGNLGAQSAYAWNAVSKLDSGEKHSSLFNKISTMFKNIRTIAKFLGTTDISAIGDGTVSGAIFSLNNSLTNSIKVKTLTSVNASNTNAGYANFRFSMDKNEIPIFIKSTTSGKVLCSTEWAYYGSPLSADYNVWAWVLNVDTNSITKYMFANTTSFDVEIYYYKLPS